MRKILVIGSGPSAWATCHALIEKGLTPIVWDAGEKLPDEGLDLKNQLRTKTTETLSKEDAAKLYSYPNYSNSKTPTKSLYGSNFFLGFKRDHSPLVSQDSLIAPTFAFGGFAVGWGGAVLPVRDDDMLNWPLKASELSPHYERVMKHLPLAGGQADKGEIGSFPLFKDSEDLSVLPISPRMKKIQRKLSSVLPNNECQVARLTLHTDGDYGCTNCGLCLTGCPQNSIFSFANTFSNWAKAGKVQYFSNRIVVRISEDNKRPTVKYLEGSSYHEESFDKVFLGAGAISTARIVLESLDKYDESVELLDSQKFILPMIQLWPINSFKAPSNFELPSLFWDFISDKRWVHLQINEAGGFTKEHLPRFIPEFLKSILVKNLLVGLGGFHSDHSSSFNLSLKKDSANGRPVLHIKLNDNTQHSKAILKKAVKAMSSSLLKIGILSPSFLSQLTKPGLFHFGGTLPMTSNGSSDLETNELGCLPAWKSVHLIDGSVLPSISSTTIALIIMANADRIALESLKETKMP